MELVKGVPITEYCDEARLAPRERIELLVAVCQAIQHAHQKGIIHRDIKPSNVLVSLYDGRPVPKVIDFGLAKATDQRLTERTLFTRYGAIVGTLEYMSPEQAENSAVDVDTRTDIYALGVLLYELLTGTTPLERLRSLQAGYSEILRRIREEEPPQLSARISKSEQVAAIAARRGMEPAKLARLVRGELDWIAMKALEKDRARRYATANDLARDLERYLAGEPVEAGPPSAGYRVRKYAVRHRAALATVAAFLALTGRGLDRQHHPGGPGVPEGQRAGRSEAEAKATLRLLPRQGPGRGPARGPREWTGRGRDPPGGHRRGRAVHRRRLRRPAQGRGGHPQHPRDELLLPGRAGRRDPPARAGDGACADTLGPDHEDTLDSMDTLALAYQAAGRYAEAIPLHETAYRIFLARRGPEDPATLGTMSNLATAYGQAGRPEEAIATGRASARRPTGETAAPTIPTR